MKRKIKSSLYLLFALGLSTLTACSDYFDVRPKSQVLAEELFEDEQGFNGQLIGVYKRMASTSLYAREMNFGLMEVLSQNYDLPTGSAYEEAAKYNYRNSGIKTRIESIWSEMYTAIANLNLMLEYIDKNASVFSGNNYHLYKGEALGLRAFLHFDLLRIFAPAYTSNKTAPAIPYVTQYTTDVTKQSTVEEVIGYVIGDLKNALTLLEIDPLYTADSTDAYNYRDARSYRFNYYAVAATLARAYQWKGTTADLAEALNYAEKIIEDKHFSWVHYSAITSSNKYERDLLFTPELIFQINVTDMDELVKPYFKENSDKTQKLSPTITKWEAIYEFDKGYGAEWRSNKHWEYDGSDPYFAKYWQYENGTYKDHMPIIRWSEMHYIAAEASLNTNPQQAVRYLNIVRENRQIDDPLDENLSAERIREEIYKEYRKETVGEGQLFYYYKRMGYISIPGSSALGNDNIYVLPMPDNEIEFGNRK